MKPNLLFIGSTCADVVVRIPRIPESGGDEHISSQQVNLGGCACNAFRAARAMGLADCMLFSPVGQGVWGDWVAQALAIRGIATALPRVDEENGCCYCLVEDGGERTFLSHHGAEYRFRREWFTRELMEKQDAVYLCGLEVEEPDGENLLCALEDFPPKCLYFAPGPRLRHIPPQRMARVLALHPVMHLNRGEALAFTGADSVEEAAAMLRSVTGNTVIVTLGPEGAYACSDEWTGRAEGFRAEVTDTIGAGDAHIGVVMVCRAAGMSLQDSLLRANKVAARVVTFSGVEGLN